MATIYDVAKLAGVSIKTVSRVLNEDAPVSARTKAAVQEAMDSLGYVPSLAARSIKSQKSGLIGLITGAISISDNEVTTHGLPELHIVQGIQHLLGTTGKTLLISDTGGQLDRVGKLIRTFQEHRVEGLIYVSDHHQRVDLPLPGNEIATVLVNCYDEGGTPCILPDDEAGQYALTQAVIARGHRRLGYLTLGERQDATRLRLEGFRRALAEAGIDYDPDLVAPAEMSGTPGEHQLIWDALDRFLRNPEPPTVICCGNDRLAMAVYGILRDRGVSIPDDMSVAGYDDHRLVSETLYPGLTTAELPYLAMGGRAAQLLLDLIDSPGSRGAADPILVGGQVRIRGSLAERRGSNTTIININRRKRT